jgi:hypothetical protein
MVIITRDYCVLMLSETRVDNAISGFDSLLLSDMVSQWEAD